ncbi:cell cycle control protein 50C, putative [Entamoeba invadens IP1]|uniref:Cell cycle control protein 50C, putative n=2 Tax=Entamoeba invadens TaxID=33085 RepID=A0A0A1TZG9_ENTIV|nr:cell cycle control protein 50C, putative [Entamoeba invadens IP1]ELP83930.1 cell cycle control protein 50C, putative [Entamoeba invadens IP1]BAN40806.1 cell cycle control protein 50C, putative [Entamoeba invadens]BAN42221.1 cell cycle control protein 50C, putative [Entamoeba invadens]|eukprot:XP_004183276.1 cell cycle control protein 50C, putative [Entamoeba invadens IP1]
MSGVKNLVTKTFSTSFKQQEMRSCVPLYRPITVILFFLITGLIFIPIGIAVFVVTNQCQEYSVMYVGENSPVNCKPNVPCEFTFTVTKPMKTPVYVYYELTNFYQNHREYLRSRSNKQLKGAAITKYNDLSDCAPRVSLNDSTKPEDFYEPCGLVAASFFNDTFKIDIGTAGNATELVLEKDKINWKSDKNLFKNPKEKNGISVVDDYTDPDFINWMRPAVSSTFRKLTGIINNVDEVKGNITVTVVNNFPVTSFGGTKTIILATTSVFGSKNPALGIIYMAVGGVFVIIAILLFILTKTSPRKFADKRFLRW